MPRASSLYRPPAHHERPQSTAAAQRKTGPSYTPPRPRSYQSYQSYQSTRSRRLPDKRSESVAYKHPQSKERQAANTSAPVKSMSYATNSQWVGASILLFSIAPDGYVYFLLGKEATHEGYKESGMWSDFGGGASLQENEYDCAAREFLEETQRCINPFPATCGHTLPDASAIAHELRNENYTARIDFNFLDTRRPRTYTTFLVKIPWDPSVRARFAKRTRSSTQQPFPTINRYSNFQGKLNSRRHGQPEKTAIEYFSVPAILDTEPAHTRRVGAIAQPKFRKFFMSRMVKVLALVFPKNVAKCRTLEDPEACRALYQGSGVRIPLLKHKDTCSKKWSRGVQLPSVAAGGGTLEDQPPSRIFHNFNTHKKYADDASTMPTRTPVDKIFY